MASVVQVASNHTTNGTTCTATLGTPATAGNVLVAVMTTNRAGATNIVPPTGYTSRLTDTNGAGVNYFVATTTAAGGETSVSFTAALGNSRMLLTVFELSGVDEAPTIGTSEFSTGTSATLAAVTGAGVFLAGIGLGTGVANPEVWSDWTSSSDWTTQSAFDAVTNSNNVGQSTATSVQGSSVSLGGSVFWTTSVANVGAILLFPASGPAVNHGSATGSVAVTGSATGSRVAEGSATGSVAASGSATGSRVSEGSATASVAVTGSATGHQPPNSGSATGSVSITGSASGTAPVVGGNNGSATGSVSITGSATGSRVSEGSASGVATATGDASGSRISEGSATGSVGTTATASGHMPGVTGNAGSATGSVSVTGSASGHSPNRGSATGLCSITGSGSGGRVSRGSATGLCTITGSARAAISVPKHEVVKVTEHLRSRYAAETTRQRHTVEHLRSRNVRDTSREVLVVTDTSRTKHAREV